MCAQRETDVDFFIFRYLNVGQGVDEFAVELPGRTVFKAAELGGEQVVEAIADDREDVAEIVIVPEEGRQLEGFEIEINGNRPTLVLQGIRGDNGWPSRPRAA